MGRYFKPLKLKPIIIYDKDYKVTHVSLTMKEYISILTLMDKLSDSIGKLKEKKPIIDPYYDGVPMKRKRNAKKID